MENLVPKCIDLRRRNIGRTGRSFRLPLLSRTASTRLKTIRDDSYFVQSVKLFDSLPRNIRDLKGCSVEKFKSELDKFLLKLPDPPLIPGYTASSLVGSNSVLDWCNWLNCVRKYEGWTVWDTPWPGVKAPKKNILDEKPILVEHIELLVQSSKIRTGMLLTVFKTREPELMIKMFNSYVRSTLEYCSLVWNPWKREDKDKFKRGKNKIQE